MIKVAIRWKLLSASMAVALIGLTAAVILTLNAPELPQQLFAGMFAAGFGLVFWLIYLFFRRLSASLLELSSAVNDLAGGRLERRVRIPARDDLAELAGILNQMASALENRVGEITEE